ncbi:ABC transporter substrate-binding protein [Acidaminobacter sp. JC074]|uniref:ABC transporter substrate-binding protein n=1 Tax=Acidaminobacter sp. JC074 TaxID=2530199 RepID=UPI001F0E6839|nr:ABC transporter substrate-binding protein [Acidaminobacter sp. JC074]MCH4889950.1 ABC transporter substrate-binding protein [Acidaminobacter sp. JC074]
MKKIILMVMILTFLVSCQSEKQTSFEDYSDWDQVLQEGQGQTVTILMWGGNESINQYMDGYVSDHLKEMYDITLNRVPMNAPEYLNKLLNEKKSGVEIGTADLLWINAENFKTAKQGGLLSGPFTHLLPNLNTYYDQNASDLSYDSGIAIEGYEGIWGRAQLVFTGDDLKIKSYAELLDYAKSHPGRITYPRIPDDFVGVAFFRNAYYELTGETDIFQTDMTRDEFEILSQSVIDYFKDLHTYMWNQGQVLPASQAQLDELFRNGEVDMTMGFEIGKTAGLVASGVYDESVKPFVFETGTIGNSHYLAVPYNSPEKAGALLVIDFLESPPAQVEKMKSDVWGDMPAFDTSKVDDHVLEALNQIESKPGSLTLETLTEHRNPEMKAIYVEWIKEIWIEEFAQ